LQLTNQWLLRHSMPNSVKCVVTFNSSRLRRQTCATMEDYNSSLLYEIWCRQTERHYASLYSCVQDGSSVEVPLVMNKTAYLAYGCFQTAFNCNIDCKLNGYWVTTTTVPTKIFLHKKEKLGSWIREKFLIVEHFSSIPSKFTIFPLYSCTTLQGIKNAFFLPPILVSGFVFFKFLEFQISRNFFIPQEYLVFFIILIEKPKTLR
jgi:hypothetical protein